MVRAKSGNLDLVKTFEETYFALRILLTGIAAALPFWLVAGESLSSGKFGVRDSISAYYSSGMRDWFVGSLFAVGAGVYLYKGLSERENWLLNAAGAMAVLTAVFPHNLTPAGWPGWLPVNPHAIFAISFFVFIALVCWFCKRDSIELNLIEAGKQAAYLRKYNGIAVLLVLVAVLAGIGTLFQWNKVIPCFVYAVETFGLELFAYYWYTKSAELRQAIDRAKQTF